MEATGSPAFTACEFSELAVPHQFDHRPQYLSFISKLCKPDLISLSSPITPAVPGSFECKMAEPNPDMLNAGMASLSIEELNEATRDDQQEDHTTTSDGELIAPEPSTDQHSAHDPFAISVGALRAINRTRRAAGLAPLSVEDVEELEERGEEGDYLEALQAEKREAWKARRQEEFAKQPPKKRAKKALREEEVAEKRAEKQALKEQKRQEREAKLEEKRAERAESARDTALVTLAGSDYLEFNSNILVDKILRAMEDKLAANPNLILLGRTAGFFRINYDPTARDITSIWSRLGGIFSTGGNESIDYIALERLLFPFVSSNRERFTIPAAKKLSTDGGRRLDERSYRSSWFHNQALFNEISPIDLPKRDAVISSVIEAMTEKCRKVDPNSLLLLSPYVKSGGEEENEHRCQWGLSSLYSGLVARIRECFSGPEVHSEVYEDRIEQVLYSYKMANKTAIYGARKSDYFV